MCVVYTVYTLYYYDTVKSLGAFFGRSAVG